MTGQLVTHSYGKSQVRISRITRTADRHEFIEITASIALEGDFDSAYTQHDNRTVIPTDTMKNTVYLLAHTHGIASIEYFALQLAQHFLKEYPHVSAASVTLEERPWDRIETDGVEQPHGFIAGGTERCCCDAILTRGTEKLRSGLTGLQVLKTTGSGFSDFLRDQYTTLPETKDRIFATTIEARWPCRNPQADWSDARRTVRDALLKTFVEQYSPSVQATLFQMATAAFDSCSMIDEISITMPNQHYLLANLDPLGMNNENVTFVPSREPFGLISGTVHRNETVKTS